MNIIKIVLVDLSKLSNIVKMMLSKKLCKVKVIDTSGFVLKTKYDTDKSDVEQKSMTVTRKYLMLVDVLIKQIVTQK